MRGFYRDFYVLNLLSRPMCVTIEIACGTALQAGR
nr:MAG TPA: hypothetical protein [Caudoviricetes sp.]